MTLPLIVGQPGDGAPHVGQRARRVPAAARRRGSGDGSGSKLAQQPAALHAEGVDQAVLGDGVQPRRRTAAPRRRCAARDAAPPATPAPHRRTTARRRRDGGRTPATRTATRVQQLLRRPADRRSGPRSSAARVRPPGRSVIAAVRRHVPCHVPVTGCGRIRRRIEGAAGCYERRGPSYGRAARTGGSWCERAADRRTAPAWPCTTSFMSLVASSSKRRPARTTKTWPSSLAR